MRSTSDGGWPSCGQSVISASSRRTSATASVNAAAAPVSSDVNADSVRSVPMAV